jgi:hypothetical protein
MQREKGNLCHLPSQALPWSGSTGIISVCSRLRQQTPRELFQFKIKEEFIKRCNFSTVVFVLQQIQLFMKKIFGSILFAGIAVTAFAQKTFNDPNAVKRSVSGFHGVAVSGSIDLFLTQGTEETVAISANDPKWVDKVKTEVRDGTLHIYTEYKNKNVDLSFNSKKIRAYVSVKSIDYLSSAGSGKVHIEGTLKTDKLKINISGSGNMKGDLSVNDFTVSLAGSANADYSGKAEKSDFHISGSGNIGTYDLTSAFCEVSISGSGNVRTTVTKELSAHISGSGNVSIKGDGMIRDYTSSGSGKFKRVK